MNTDAIVEYYTADDEGARLAASPHTEREQAVFDSALLAARAVERDPAMHPVSAHLLVAAEA